MSGSACCVRLRKKSCHGDVREREGKILMNILGHENGNLINNNMKVERKKTSGMFVCVCVCACINMTAIFLPLSITLFLLVNFVPPPPTPSQPNYHQKLSGSQYKLYDETDILIPHNPNLHGQEIHSMIYNKLKIQTRVKTLTSATERDSMNWTKPCLLLVAKTLYGVSLRSRFSRLRSRSIRVMIWRKNYSQ